MKPSGNRGLTLLEVLAVIVIVVVLTAMILPALAPTRGGSRKSDCKNSLKQIGVYFAIYESKYKAYPPPGPDGGFQHLWRSDMAQDGNLFRCAMRGKGGSGTHYQGITWPATWRSPQGVVFAVPPTGLTEKDTPPDLPIAADDVVNHKNEDMNVLFFQGRVDVFDKAKMQEVDGFLNPVAWSAPAGTK